MTTSNWAGNYTYRASEVHQPTSVEQVQELVAAATRMRVVGTRHGFNDIADSDQLISLANLPADITIDLAAGTVSCAAGLTYGALATVLQQHGLALHNLASLPDVSLAGAITSGTHGSGDRNGNLATAVAGLELVTSTGAIRRLRRGDADFAGSVVSLGATGVVTRYTLRVEPTYDVAQRVFERLSWNALFAHFDAVMASGYSVSLFTTWGESIDQVWVKARTSAALPVELFDATPASVDRHPAAGMDPRNSTPQLGRPGPWWERLTHFRVGCTPSVGRELQSEYLLPRHHALPAIEAVRGLAAQVKPLVVTAEIRTIAADDLWMSPEFERDTLALHFTWILDQTAVEQLLVNLESALAPFEARPHWSKLFVARSEVLAPLYPRLPDFLRLVEQLDPRGAFRNEWFETHVVG